MTDSKLIWEEIFDNELQCQNLESLCNYQLEDAKSIYGDDINCFEIIQYMHYAGQSSKERYCKYACDKYWCKEKQ